MIFARVRLQLMVLHVVVMAAVIALAGAGIVLLMDRSLMAQATSELQAEARRATVEVRESDDGEFQARHNSYATGTFYMLWDLSGTPVYNPANAAVGPLRGPVAAALAGHVSTDTVALPGGQDTLVVSEPVYVGGRLVGAVQVGRSLQPIHAVEAEAIAVVAAASSGALVLSILASWFLVGRALVPVRRALSRQRDFTADASHELRTPLAAIDAGIQLLRRHPDQTVRENEYVLETIAGEAQRMGRLLASLLALARADSGEAELQVTEVDLDELVRSVAGEVNTVVAGQPRLRLVAATAGIARVDADRLRQLLLILIENALRHSPAGEVVDLLCTCRDRTLVLEVADRGPGIPVDQRERAFERFHRLDPARTGAGSGLGLPIARWIVTAHGGSISLHDNRPGLRVRVRLPVDPPAVRQVGKFTLPLLGHVRFLGR